MDPKPASVLDRPNADRPPPQVGTGVTPQPVLVCGRQSWACAACGERSDVQPDPLCGGVLFCGDCRERPRHLSDWDDLGIGD